MVTWIGPDPVFVFIDIPNIISRSDRDSVVQLDWDRLSAHVEEFAFDSTVRSFHLGVYVPRLMIGYGSQSHLAELMREAKTALESGKHRIRGYSYRLIYPTKKKDVDVCIVNDLWKSVVQYSILGARRIRIILMSGDGGFRQTIQNLRFTLPMVEIEVVLYAWKETLSTKLKIESNAVFFLNDVPDLVTETRTYPPRIPAAAQ